MRAFAELNVQITRRFTGDRIRIEKIEGDEIIITDFEIRKSKLSKSNDSNIEGNECLYLQITHNGKTRVLWGNYKFMIAQLKQISIDVLPFSAKIVNEHGYVFK